MGKKIYLYILCFLILVTSTNYVLAQNTIEISKNTSDRLFNAIQVINSVNKHNTNKVLPLAKDINIITIKKGNNVFFSAKKDVIWKVIQPINAEGEEWTFKQIVNSISDEDKYQLVDENPSDLEEYGLKNPVYTLEFGNQKGKTKIFVGRETEDTSKIYTMFENCNKVYAIEALYMDFLSKPLKEIISPFAYIVDIKDVSNLTVKFDNKLVSCDIKAYQDPKKDKFVVNGKDVSDLKD
ncbi:MAG TPA: DUF4340 domain-containing protein, partial [Clostridia bacterium]|nr:DUF4340 domain-containing protein [Clostridia bacterium]